MELDEVTRDVTRWCLKLTPYVVRLDCCGRVDKWEKRNPHRPHGETGRVDTNETAVRTVAGIRLN